MCSISLVGTYILSGFAKLGKSNDALIECVHRPSGLFKPGFCPSGNVIIEGVCYPLFNERD